MRLSFWGTRGSITMPGPDKVKYGANTACVSLTSGDHRLILDAGIGIVLLGDRIMAARKPKERLDLHLLLGHLHWDHVIGLPFFTPVFFPTTTLDIYGRRADEVEAATARLFTSTYSPIKGTENLGATLRYHSLESVETEIAGFHISSCHLHHPGGALAYRIAAEGRSVVYASDHEGGHPETDASLRALAQGADVLIHDAQWTLSDPLRSPTTGHSSWRDAVAAGLAAGVRTLILFHHHYQSRDDTLDAVGAQARELAMGRLQVIMARDGLLLEV
jgi:phosphoribosyl 1,2-cyclic phosphodiesterase